MIIAGVVLWRPALAVLSGWGCSAACIHPDEVLRYLYILSAVLFILGLKGLSSPKWARRGMFLAEFGMAVAIVGTLFRRRHHSRRATSGSASACSSAPSSAAAMGLRIPMTAVPQRTALSHSLGALAATLVGISEYVRHHTGRLERPADDAARLRGGHRRPDVHRQPDGRRQAPGTAARPPHHLQGTERLQFRLAGGHGRHASST